MESKPRLVVIIKVYPPIVNITGILEESNKVIFQRSLDNKAEKIRSFLQKVEKEYELKLYHAQDITSLEDIDRFLTKQGFQLVNPDTAGIDIGSRKHWVCVPIDRDKNNVREFGTCTTELYAIAQWLKDCRVTTVAIESTGVYWIPIFQILEEKGFKVCLANTKHMKRVPGRTKTDRIDCQWIQKLHSFGLLASSFRPDEQICQIRSLIRHRKSMVEANNRNINQMQKSLEQMNIKLALVVKDICGVSGLKIIHAILDGERDLKKLANLADPRVKASQEEIIQALRGDYRQEHLFTLKQCLDFFNFTLQKIEECEKQIEIFWQNMCPKENDEQMLFDFASQDIPITEKKRKEKRSALAYDACAYFQRLVGVDLSQIPGIDGCLAQTILSEVGLDMSPWPTENHFVSWMGLCPNQEASGTSLHRSRTRKVKNRAAIAFRQAASTLRGSKSYLGAFYRRIKARLGPAKAITATARKIAIILYKMIKFNVGYIELGENYYLNQHQDRLLKKMQQQAKLLGYNLVPEKK